MLVAVVVIMMVVVVIVKDKTHHWQQSVFPYVAARIRNCYSFPDSKFGKTYEKFLNYL